MDAVEFIKTRARMCRLYEDCENCPLDFFCAEEYQEQDSGDSAVGAVKAVEQWVKEHPVKTRQSEFLKMFPSALIDGGSLCICPKILDPKTYSTDTGCSRICNSITCRDCRRDFWLKEIE